MRRGKHYLAGKRTSSVVDKNPVSPVKTGPHFREVDTQIGKHIDVLGPFTREEKSQLANMAKGFFKKEYAASILDLVALRIVEPLQGVAKLFSRSLRELATMARRCAVDSCRQFKV
jgi:hypothetical protein